MLVSDFCYCYSIRYIRGKAIYYHNVFFSIDDVILYTIKRIELFPEQKNTIVFLLDLTTFDLYRISNKKLIWNYTIHINYYWKTVFELRDWFSPNS